MNKFLYLLFVLPFLQSGCISIGAELSTNACFYTEDSASLYLFTNGLPLGNIPIIDSTLALDDNFQLDGLPVELYTYLNENETEHFFAIKEIGQEETVAEGKIIVSEGIFSVEREKGTFEMIGNNGCIIIKVGE